MGRATPRSMQGGFGGFYRPPDAITFLLVSHGMLERGGLLRAARLSCPVGIDRDRNSGSANSGISSSGAELPSHGRLGSATWVLPTSAPLTLKKVRRPSVFTAAKFFPGDFNGG
jgi:hypothetical protein